MELGRKMYIDNEVSFPAVFWHSGIDLGTAYKHCALIGLFQNAAHYLLFITLYCHLFLTHIRCAEYTRNRFKLQLNIQYKIPTDYLRNLK